MVFSKVGPIQSIEWGQIRVSKSFVAHRIIQILHVRLGLLFGGWTYRIDNFVIRDETDDDKHERKGLEKRMAGVVFPSLVESRISRLNLSLICIEILP
jgi:hypothetical protein